MPNKSEGAVMRTLLVYAAEFKARLFRNQVGHYVVAQDDCKSCQRFGRRITSGLCPGSSDLIGWMPVMITPEMVGQTFARFVAVEAKREQGGTLQENQRAFLAQLERDGALAGVARSVGDLEEILGRKP